MEEPHVWMYKYTIYDDDVGGIIREDEYYDFKYLLEAIKQDIFSYEWDEVEGEEAKEDLKYWDPNVIYKTLDTFDFYGGLMEWCCWLPGHHRKMNVSFVKKIV